MRRHVLLLGLADRQQPLPNRDGVNLFLRRRVAKTAGRRALINVETAAENDEETDEAEGAHDEPPVVTGVNCGSLCASRVLL